MNGFKREVEIVDECSMNTHLKLFMNTIHSMCFLNIFFLVFINNFISDFTRIISSLGK